MFDLLNPFKLYHPTQHCMMMDWPWVIAMVVTKTLIFVAYFVIFHERWRRAAKKLKEGSEARQAIESLANIFLFCGVAGYLFVLVDVFYPIRRVEVILHFVLLGLCWRFIRLTKDKNVIIDQVKKAEDDSAPLPQRHLEFLSQVPVPICQFDRDMNVVSCSESWIKTFKLPETIESIVGKNHYDLFPEITEDHYWRDVHNRVMEENISLRSPVEGETMVRKKDYVLIFRWMCSPWYDQEGHVAGLIALADIEKKKTELDGDEPNIVTTPSTWSLRLEEPSLRRDMGSSS